MVSGKKKEERNVLARLGNKEDLVLR